MNKMKKILLWGSGTFATLGAMTGVAGAVAIQKIPIFGGNWKELVAQLINWILIIMGIVAVLFLIYGGVVYLTAGGDAEKAGKGRVVITNAIIGIVIIAASFAIYQFVGSTLTNQNPADTEVNVDITQ